MGTSAASPPDAATLRVVLGNQLFPLDRLPARWSTTPVFMAEDVELCTYVPHHKQKLVLFLAAMRSYADALEAAGISVHYERLDDSGRAYFDRLGEVVDARGIERLVVAEVEDKFFEARLKRFVESRSLTLETLESPMFLTPRATFEAYLDAAERGRGPFMADFYQQQRKRLNLLMDGNAPVGGKWSFDAENREKLPKNIELPTTRGARATEVVREVSGLVADRFPDHPGELSTSGWWLPTTRAQALEGLDAFLTERFEHFGTYEDALSQRDPFLFHSVLTPALNLGLITPDEIIGAAIVHWKAHDIPLNSVEGFVRQIIGWREFVRGIYRRYSQRQETTNHFGHRRGLTRAWWTGETGLPPLDHSIRKALRWGWCHHIERLMVQGNLMTLCEIAPREAHDWFMAMFVDSSDWVMGPNVYGMALHSDGGIFATKPYVCSSNYLRKMSDWGRGDWCDVVDGLYWRFIDRHRDEFEANPRMVMMVRALDRLSGERRERIDKAAEAFLKRATICRENTEDG